MTVALGAPLDLGRRREAVVRLLAARGWDHLVVAGTDELHRYGYLTWVTGTRPGPGLTFAVLGRSGTGRVVSSAGEVAEELRSRSAGRVGTVGVDAIAGSGLRRSWAQELGAVEVVDATADFARVKATPSPEDHAGLGQARTLADRGMDVLREAAGRGESPAEACRAAEDVLAASGVWLHLVRLASRMPLMDPPRRTPIRAGELMTAYVEVASPAGYWAEVVRTCAWGALSPEDEHRLGVAQEVLRIGVALLRPGQRAGTVAERVIAAAAAHGFACGPTIGHAVGIDDHDPPRLEPEDDRTIEVGMVLALHPCLRSPSGEAVTVGDTFLVEEDGTRPLGRAEPLHLAFPADEPRGRGVGAMVPGGRAEDGIGR